MYTAPALIQRPSMTKDTPKSISIEDPAILQVLANPVRWEILGAIMTLDEGSAAEIAKFTARSRTSIYPHIQKLIDADLVLEAGTRLMGKRYEQLYKPCANNILMVFNKEDPKNLEFHITFAKSLSRFLARRYEQAAKDPDANPRSDQRNIHAGSNTAWVNDEELAQLNKHINAIWDICNNSTPGEGKQLIQIGLFQSALRTDHDG